MGNKWINQSWTTCKSRGCHSAPQFKFLLLFFLWLFELWHFNLQESPEIQKSVATFFPVWWLHRNDHIKKYEWLMIKQRLFNFTCYLQGVLLDTFADKYHQMEFSNPINRSTQTCLQCLENLYVFETAYGWLLKLVIGRILNRVFFKDSVTK